MNVKLELPEFVNSAVNPLAESIGETLKSIWSITFGPIDNYAQKISIKRNKDLEMFKQKIEEDIKKIPKEDISEPKLNILGPTMESSKYYFEEENLRNMFAKLIASSINSKKQESIHPSFPSIIQNLSAKDAEFIKYLKDSNSYSIPCCELRYQKRTNENFTNFFSYITDGITLNSCLLNIFYKENPEYDFVPIIDNLLRLHILSKDDRYFSDNLKYYGFLDNAIFLKENNKYSTKESFSDKEVTMIKNIISVTEFGEKFISCCV